MFNESKLSPQILENIKQQGYEKPTPIQSQAIPPILSGNDVLGIAQTGTGKTGAFTLPIINNLMLSNRRVNKLHTRCLILTPTRELAGQIKDNITSYTKNMKITSTVVFGGVNKNTQIRQMRAGTDILVATPGRLLDLMSDNYVKLSQVEAFVLDEADRMLDMGFIKDIKKVIALLPQKKQTLLFSATMPKGILNLATSLLKNPVKIEVTPQATTVEKIDQSVVFSTRKEKLTNLLKILDDKSIKSMLVFTRTKHHANRVAENLRKKSIMSAAIHGNKSQNARQKALSEFKSGKLRVLVATDIAARGIDISSVTHIINYELPNVPESYVHRIGRTARAGRDGVAIAFCDETERGFLKDIEKFIRMKIPVNTTLSNQAPIRKITTSRQQANNKKKAYKKKVTKKKPQQLSRRNDSTKGKKTLKKS